MLLRTIWIVNKTKSFQIILLLFFIMIEVSMTIMCEIIYRPNARHGFGGIPLSDGPYFQWLWAIIQVQCRYCAELSHPLALGLLTYPFSFKYPQGKNSNGVKSHIATMWDNTAIEYLSQKSHCFVGCVAIRSLYLKKIFNLITVVVIRLVVDIRQN